MRIIDADALLKKAHNYYPSIDHYCCSRKAVDIKDITEAPTIDAVVVIRCEGCGWYRPDSETCSFWPDEGYRHPKHFCGEGKPK